MNAKLLVPVLFLFFCSACQVNSSSTDVLDTDVDAEDELMSVNILEGEDPDETLYVIMKEDPETGVMYNASTSSCEELVDTGDLDLRIPLGPGSDIGINQSWGCHCSECDVKYSGDKFPYCSDSHIYNSTFYGWDFGLPGSDDSGLSVLASGHCVIKKIGWNESWHQRPDESWYKKGWGRFVICDHGDNICSRYGHLIKESTDHLSEGMFVCQGFVIGGLGTTGASTGPHLHFQFETCDDTNPLPIPVAFTDGNGVPKCKKGDDRYDANGAYTALTLINIPRTTCDGDEPVVFDSSGSTWPAWDAPVQALRIEQCGDSLGNCPLNSCDRVTSFAFTDEDDMSPDENLAAKYLYHECALDGKEGKYVAADDNISRVEGLKVATHLFGMSGDCGSGGLDAIEIFDDISFWTAKWIVDTLGCGIHYGLIDTGNKSFRPNDLVTYPEAAKILIAAAKAKNLIQNYSPKVDYFPLIPDSFWGYDDLQLIMAYGGISKDEALTIKAADNTTRGEFFRMAAHLSPCFCGNVICDDNCECSQNSFTCYDPNDDGGTGGPIDGADNDVKIDLNCSVRENWTECVDGSLVIDFDCEIENFSDQELKLKDMVVSLSTFSDQMVCSVTDDNMITGVAYQKFEPGETKTSNGHWRVTCSSMPSDNMLDVSFDLYEKNTGTVIEHPNFIKTIVLLDPNLMALCLEPSCVPSCDALECGDDGCGDICGNCSGNDICVNGLCECQPLSCAMIGANCGSVFNGCETVSCGSCIGGFHCEYSQCVEDICVPVSCDDMDYQCGSVYNGCEMVNCGTCSSGYQCYAGNCNCVPQSCDQMGHECGAWFNGCGSYNCGQCDSGKNCVSGVCESPVCVPNSCANMGKNCGIHNDGCNDVNCGTCPTGSQCLSGQCVQSACSGCPAGSECVNNLCYFGDWACDPAVGYTLKVKSSDATLSIIESSGTYTPNIVLQNNIEHMHTVACADLPLVAYVELESGELAIHFGSDPYPPMGYWKDYSGPLTTEPGFIPYKISVGAGYTFGYFPKSTFLFRVPELSQTCSNKFCPGYDPCDYCPSESTCIDGKCWFGDWACDPTEEDYAYRFRVHVLNGSYQVLLNTGELISNTPSNYDPNFYHVSCDQLPLAVLIDMTAGEHNIYSSYQPFPLISQYGYYFDNISINPSGLPDMKHVAFGMGTTGSPGTQYKTLYVIPGN